MKPDLTCLDPESSVLVACSGGRDSMALLCALIDVGYDVAAAHIDHAMRGTSARDAEFVRKFCAARGIPCYVRRAEIALGNEAEARAFRLKALSEIAKEYGYTQIALAHHRGDQAETVLMNLLRGCGSSGAAGIRGANGILKRPLLGVSRAEIDAYVLARQIPYVDDETNFEATYTRNFIRNRVMPEIAVKYPEYERAVSVFAGELREINDYLDVQLPAFEACRGEILLGEQFGRLPPVLLRRAVYLAATRLRPANMTRVQIERIAALYDAQTGTVLEVGGNLRAARDADAIALYLERPAEQFIQPWIAPDSQPIAIGDFVLSRTQSRAIPPKPALIFDADAVPANAVWRTRNIGDVFTPFGGGTRPLKEFLIDRKVPGRMRDKMPLLCYNNTILVVSGMEISRGVRVTERTKHPVTLGEYSWKK